MDTLHFREYQRGKMVSKKESFPDADIHFNEVLSDAIRRGERIQDTLACIHWKESLDSVTSTLTLTQPKFEDPDRIDEEFCEAMVRDPTQLHTFIRDVHKHQAVKLITVKVHPIAFTFRHLENDLFVRCAKDFMDAIRCLISNSVRSKPEIKATLKVNRDNRDTCTSSHLEFWLHRTGSQPTSYSMAEERNTQNESGISTKERFAVINREMTKQKHFIESQFALHRQQNGEIISTLSRVLCTLQASSTSDEIRKVIAEEKERLTQSFQGFEKNDEPRSTVKDESQTELASHTSPSTLGSGHQLQRNGPHDFSPTDYGTQKNHGCTHEPVHKEGRSESGHTKGNDGATASTADETSHASVSETKPENSRNPETSGTINTAQKSGGGKVLTKYPRKNTPLFSSSTSSNVMTLDRLKARQEMSGYKPFGKGEGQKVKTLANLKEEERKEGGEKHLHDPGTVDRDDVLKSVTSGRLFVPITKERTSSGQSSIHIQRLELDVQSLISSSPDDTRLWRAVEDIYQQDDGSLRAEAALDTVFCLDTSGSISEQAFAQMKDIVLDFLTGIEEVAEKYDIEENVALVTFGGKAKVIHHLSNDYASLQDALEKVERGGPSPLLQSLLVALACLSRGGICNMGGLLVPPRIVFITDGLASAELPETSRDTVCPSDRDRMRLIGAVGQLGSEHARTYIASPLVWIPIGEADRTFLESMVKLCHGKLIEGKDVKTLCNHQRLRRIASNVLVYMRRQDTDSDNLQSEMEMVIDALGGTLTTSEKEEITTLVEMNIYNVESGNLGAVDSFDNITTRDNLPPLGSRVVRGPDWRWGNQDSQGPGTVINHDADGPSVWVLWDTGNRNVYRCGLQNEFDVLIVDDQPRIFGDSHRVEIGAQVERGPHWQESYGNQDGGPGSHGVVIRRQGQRIMVRWENGSIHKYRFGENNMYDVVMRDPFACLPEKTSLQSTKKSDTNLSLGHPQHTEKHGRPETDRPFVWQRNDGHHGWQDYAEAENAKLMTEYKKRQMGSCLLSRNGQSFRISFRNNIERSVEDNTTADIRKRFTD
ncbi:uncharacterized protein [Haliotis asinina]|uniref:uncharacterized protein n=1 Tax=Haliotis asinina TaxID=109174 RepID=UPI003531B314